MDKYVAKLDDYFKNYIEELRDKFIKFNIDLKKGKITEDEYNTAASKIHYFNNLASNIKYFFSDGCEDVLGYFYELSCHLVPPIFTSKEAYQILKFAIEKSYRNAESTPNELPALEKVQAFKFKSLSERRVTELINSGRFNSIIDGSAKDVTLPEQLFIKEFNENYGKFKISLVEYKKKISNAYSLLDKFDSYKELEQAFRELGVSDECVRYIDEHIKHRLNRKNKKDGNMKIVDKFLVTLKDVKEAVLEEERNCTLKKIMETDHRVVFDVEDIGLVNEATGAYATDEIDEITKYFSFQDDEYVEKKIFFRDFLRVTTYLDKSFGFTPKEAFQLISLLTERNHAIAALSDARTVFDHEALRRIKFETITQAEIEHIFKTPKLLEKFYSEDNLSEKEKEQRDEIEAHMDEFIQDYTEFCNVNDAFYLGFVKIFPNINLEDIINAINNLSKLEVKQSIIDALKGYFLSIFRTSMQRNNEVYDMDLNDTYLSMLVEDEDERKEIHEEMERHNNLVSRRIEQEIESMSKSQDKTPNVQKKETIIYLTEKDVRALKKYIRQFFDMYHARIVAMPNYQELIKCINNLEKLEEDHFAISRIIGLVVSRILNSGIPDSEGNVENYDDYLSSYDELITLVGYLIKYKVSRNHIDAIIRYYKHLKPQSADIVTFMKESIDEIKLYDVPLGDDITSLLEELDVSTKEDYDAIISLLKECMVSVRKYSRETDYEYNLALKKLGR